MSTIDKVNHELSVLESELNKLKSYTTEIGKAKNASEEVISASKEFVSNFKKRIDAIGKTMEDASNSFTLKSEASYAELEKVSSKLQTQTQKAEKTLQDIGLKLEGTADGINAMAQKFNSINLTEHFDKLYLSLERLEKNTKQIQKDLNQRILELKSHLEASDTESKNRFRLILIIVLVSLLIQIGLVGLSIFR